MIDPATVPVEPGAYGLLVRLHAPWTPRIPRLAERTLAAGLYIYCGSAYGPGGLRARVARHLRRRKTVRWHVDGLTAAGEVEGVAVRVGGRECDLVAGFLARGAAVPLAGFGSSDCRRCRAHLLALADRPGIFLRDAVVRLGPADAASL